MSDLLAREYEKALDAIEEGNDGAVELCCRRMIRTAPDDLRTIEIQAELALLRTNFSAAQALFEKLVSQADTEFVIIGLGRIGDLYGQQGELDKANDYHRKVVAIAAETRENTHLVNSLQKIARAEHELGRLQQSVDVYTQIREHILSLDDEEAEEFIGEYIDACQEQADVLRMMGRMDEARELLHEVVDKCEAMESPIGVATALCSLGVICQIESRYDEAEGHHRKSVEISEEEGWDDGLSLNYGNLAMLNINRRNFDEAERYATLAYRIDREERDQAGKIHYYQLLTTIEIERGRLEKAEVYGQKALKLSERHGDREDIAVCHGKLGFLYRKMGRFAESEKWTVLSLEAVTEMEHDDGIAAQQFELAELRKAEGKIAEAGELARTALKRYQDLNSAAMIQEVEQFIATLGT